jgi:hypothetical protein
MVRHVHRQVNRRTQLSPTSRMPSLTSTLASPSRRSGTLSDTRPALPCREWLEGSREEAAHPDKSAAAAAAAGGLAPETGLCYPNCALPGVASRRLSDRSGTGHEPSSRSTEAVGAKRSLLETTVTRLLHCGHSTWTKPGAQPFMIANSLCGIPRSLDGLAAVRAIALTTARGVVCPPCGPRAGFVRRYQGVERLAAWRGRDSKDPRMCSAQTGGEGPGP